MSYLLVGALLLALFYWGGRPGRLLKHPEWRVASGLAAIGVFAAAAFVGVRGGWGKALVLAMLGLDAGRRVALAAAGPDRETPVVPTDEPERGEGGPGGRPRRDA